MASHTNTTIVTIGILYPGEMGSALARALNRAGHRVVTTLEGRSPRTTARCAEAGIEVLSSLADVARQADVIFSVTPPAAALSVARAYADAGPALDTPPVRCPIYVDANSVSPQTAEVVEQTIIAAGARFVDMAVQGLASGLQTRGLVYLSGADAPEVARLFEGAARAVVVGDHAGQAAGLKMALAGLAKGVAALFVETALAARAAGLAEPFLQRCREAYSGVLEVAERMLPTYPEHAARRAQELSEVEEFFKSLGLKASVSRGARRVTEAMAGAGLDRSSRSWEAVEVIEELYRRGALRRRGKRVNENRRAPW